MFDKSPWPLKDYAYTSKPQVIAVADYKGELVEVLNETDIGKKEYLINYGGPIWVNDKYIKIIDRYWPRNKILNCK